MRLNLKYFGPLMRSSGDDIYLGIVELDELMKSGIKVLQSNTISNQWITIVYGSIAQESQFVIKILDSQLLSALPHGTREDEYPVLFISSSQFLPTTLESALLSIKGFASLIEKKQNLSKNSTKVMTQQSLSEILLRVFNVTLSEEERVEFQQSFLEYVDELQRRYNYLSYLPLIDRQSFRRKYVSDLSFAWEMYFRYFLDNWWGNKTAPIPDLSRQYGLGGWEGNFFDRDNPIWVRILSDRQKFKLNQNQRQKLYTNWVEWLRE